MSGDIKKIVLAYSGGLDTSVILRWLKETYRCEVVAFSADLGQGEELEPARDEGRTAGRQPGNIYHRRPARGVRPRLRLPDAPRQRALRGHIPARHLDRAAAHRQAPDGGRRRGGADAVAHGATGKGNDQVRFELGYYALTPDIKVIAPWREWDLNSRTRLIDYAEQHQIPIAKDKRARRPTRSTATSSTSPTRAGLEDPWAEPDEDMFTPHRLPGEGPRHADLRRDRVRARQRRRGGRRGAVAGRVLTRLNELGGEHGIGRVDLVENRFVGMKSPRRLRDPRRHHPLAAHRGDREHHPRPRAPPPEGRR